MDKLEQIFEEQKALNLEIADKHDGRDGLPELVDLMTGSGYYADHIGAQEMWIQNFALAMQQEVSELTDSTRWKWWSRAQTFDVQNARVELIDILHFWVSACQVMGMDANDVYQVYMQKNAVNHARQESGYKVKVEDCKHIGLTDADLDAAVESAAEKADGNRREGDGE